MKKIFFFAVAMLASVCVSASQNIAPGDSTLSVAIKAAAAGDTLILSTGDYVEPNSIAISQMVTIMAGEDQEPVIKAGSHFDLQDGGLALIGVKMDAENAGDYLVSVSGNGAMNIILEGCEICNYKKYMLNINSKYHVDSVFINDCFIHDMTRSVIYCYENESENKLPGCSYFKMTNSTSANMGAVSGVANVFVRNNKLDSIKEHEPVVVIDHVTMYNVQASYGMVKTDGGDVAISNSIFDLTKTSVPALALVKSGQVNNSLFYDTDKGGDATFNNCIEGQDPKFVDAANLNLQLSWDSPAAEACDEGEALGDPRWGVAERPTLGVDTLSNAAAVLAGEDISLVENVITWNENNPPASNTATWNVNLQAGTYAVIINQTTGSGHNFKLTASYGGNEVGSVSEEADTWAAGDLKLKGTFNAAVDGQYTLVLTNLTEWSAADAVYVILKRYELTGLQDIVIPSSDKQVKVLKNGILYIMKDGKIYDVLGNRF